MVHPVTLQGLPFDANSSFLRGAAQAPAAIREAIRSPSANMWTELGVDLSNQPEWRDAGDLSISGWPGSQANVAIQGSTEKLLEAGHRILSFGGDHSVSFPLIATHNARYPKLGVLQIDAHGDLYENFENNPLSHASVFARLLEGGHIGRLVQVGVRTLTQHQREQALRYEVEVYEMKDHRELPDLAFEGDFYISFDLDGLDPAFAPGVSHHEPGGLTSRQVIDLIHRVKGNLIGADIVELNPQRDFNGMTAMVAARIAKELTARLMTGVTIRAAEPPVVEATPEPEPEPAPEPEIAELEAPPETAPKPEPVSDGTSDSL